MAVAIVLQALRLVLPLPPVISTFIIGSLVNMMLIVTCRISGFKAAAALSILLPLLAYIQGQLLIPLLIPVVAVGNLFYTALLRKKINVLINYILPPIVKAAFMFIGAQAVLFMLHLSGGVLADNILFAMSVPQFITGIAGIAAAEQMLLKLKNLY